MPIASGVVIDGWVAGELRMLAHGRVKGVSFLRTVQMIHDLIGRGVLSSEMLEVELSRDALSIVEHKLEPSLWYSVQAVDELSKLVVDYLGDGDAAFMQVVGGRALGALLERETFRAFIEGAMKRKGNEGDTLIGLASLLYDFGTWRYEGEDLRSFKIVMDDAEPLPDLATHSIKGFIHALVEHCTGVSLTIDVRRPWRGRLEFVAAS